MDWFSLGSPRPTFLAFVPTGIILVRFHLSLATYWYGISRFWYTVFGLCSFWFRIILFVDSHIETVMVFLRFSIYFLHFWLRFPLSILAVCWVKPRLYIFLFFGLFYHDTILVPRTISILLYYFCLYYLYLFSLYQFFGPILIFWSNSFRWCFFIIPLSVSSCVLVFTYFSWSYFTFVVLLLTQTNVCSFHFWSHWLRHFGTTHAF